MSAEELVATLGVTREQARGMLSEILNEAGRDVRAGAARLLAERLGDDESKALEALRLYESTPSQLVAVVSATGGASPLADFAVSPTSPSDPRPPVGATVLEPWTGQRETIPGAFLAPRSGGGVGLFERRGPARLPIDELFADSLAVQLGEVKPELDDLVDGRLDARLEELS